MGNWAEKNQDARAKHLNTVTICTPLGVRERLSCGEVTDPTYYGVLLRGDRAELLRLGFPRRAVRAATGICTNGDLVIWRGQYSVRLAHRRV